MNTFKSLSPLLLFLFLCFACEKPLPTLEGIDAQRWAQDKNACGDIRSSLRQVIEAEKQKLIGLDEMQVVTLLGKPDQNELSKRNEKFFYYFVEPAAACGNAADSTAKRLVIRFNAVGLAKEVSVE